MDTEQLVERLRLRENVVRALRAIGESATAARVERVEEVQAVGNQVHVRIVGGPFSCDSPECAGREHDKTWLVERSAAWERALRARAPRRRR